MTYASLQTLKANRWKSAAKFVTLFVAAAMAAAILGGEPFHSMSYSQAKALGDNCIACHQKQNGVEIKLYSNSTHAQSGVACNSCHGGDSSAADKKRAHGANLIARPDANNILTMCGNCHSAQLAMFKTGRHFPERRGAPRLDCAQCHGAHTVGALNREFSFVYFCAGCHGLEYLPALPTEFQQMLALSDDLKDALRAIKDAGREPSNEVIQRRKEIRRLMSEIVHPTDLQGALQKIPQILKLGEALKQMIGREEGAPSKSVSKK